MFSGYMFNAGSNFTITSDEINAWKNLAENLAPIFSSQSNTMDTY